MNLQPLLEREWEMTSRAEIPLVRGSPDVQFKQFSSTKHKTRPRTEHEWIGETDPKNQKNCKNQSEIAACEQKTTSEKAKFCSNTVFSLYFKFRAKKFHAAKPLALSLHFLLRVIKITTPIWLKNHENV